MGRPGVAEAVRRAPVDHIPAVGATVTLAPAEAHHLLVVCRHPRGGPVVVFDGGGREADARLIDGVGTLEIVSEPRALPSPPALHLVLGVPKGPALDAALRMAVEVGATSVHPVTTERSVPKGERPDRWMRILVGAAQQCGRADVPELAPLAPLLEAIDRLDPSLDRRVAAPGAPDGPRATGPAAVAIGPEGGWSTRELDALLARGWTPLGLGEHVLRVDTAVAVGLAAVVARPRP
ncbi:MAG: RsmE family RNA methyltransferase [Myxococcota bacterium]